MSTECMKPRLDYIELPITDYCNLKCTGCCEMSNLPRGKTEHTLEGFTNDLNRLSELFSGVDKLRIMGGEPLINPGLTQYVAAARKIFPDADIRIVSNGLLIPRLSEKQLREIKENNCGFDISAYPPTMKELKKIKAVLHSADIAFHISPVIIFFRAILEHSNGCPERSYKNCSFTRCHALRDGKLAACSYALLGSRLNREYNTSYPEDDCIDIYETEMDGRQILKELTQPHKFCEYCAAGLIPFRWSDSTTHTPEKKDWVSGNSYMNMKVFPAVTRVCKPAVLKLRSMIQDKK